MKKDRLQILVLFLFCFVPLLAQNNLQIATIPDNLRDKANSVIRKNDISFTVVSPKEGLYRETLIVTVLNEKGEDAADFHYYEDTFRELKQFSGELYDAEGKLLRKLKRSELNFTELKSDLASDDRLYYYDLTSPVCPYTVKYEYEVKYKQGIISYPSFIPQKKYNQSLENASYRLLLQEGETFKHKVFNMEGAPRKEADKKGVCWSWQVANVAALEDEPYAPPFLSLIPRLLVTPLQFVYGGYAGDMKDWKSFGLWQYGLLQGRDILPEEVKQEISSLAGGKNSEREKVEALYEYLSRSMRYVSIQLGIGGLQPIPADKVARNHFGDCKGLTNFMKALLQHVGIPANYTIISTENRRLIPDFSSAQQMNHVILQVPLSTDTLWLECTNPQLPFGYVHHSIAGHDALVIKETGGEICRLPAYPDSLHFESHQVALSLDETGKARAKVQHTAGLSQYESLLRYIQGNEHERTDFLRESLLLPQAEVNGGAWVENKSAFPSVDITYDFTSERFGTRTGNRLFIPINMFRKGFGSIQEKERMHDIYVNYGYSDTDTIRIQIPDTYAVESLPKSVLLHTAFGDFTSSVIYEVNEILIVQHLYFPSGIYGATDYKAFIRFCREITSAYRENIVLLKNNS